ncbi:MAG TPA: hypothetical protein DIC36_07760 [Gammaproteobacteria bacterium]|nr:hypothetical protein [Gammaproteobacteria bacterium]
MLLIPALIIAVIWVAVESSNKVLKRENVTGNVLEVKEVLQTKNGSAHLAQVELPDQSRIRLMLPLSPPHPVAGDRIPLVVEHYEDGKSMYALDWAAWIDSSYAR